MSEETKIEWTDSTFNPVRGCTKISPGCANCYAAREARRFPKVRGIWGDSGTRITAVPSAWNEVMRWDRQAARTGKPHKVFCASLADIFEDWKGPIHLPCRHGIERGMWNGTHIIRESDPGPRIQYATMDHVRLMMLRMIARTPHLTWLLLTKRPGSVIDMIVRVGRMANEAGDTGAGGLADWCEAWIQGQPPQNVWMGTTTEDQERADRRIPQLLEIPAKVRFLSVEPMLGLIDVKTWFWSMMADQGNGKVKCAIDWVICGGESGPGFRPFNPDWARSLRDQCKAAGVAFFMKQMGGAAKPFPPIPDDLNIREFPRVERGIA